MQHFDPSLDFFIRHWIGVLFGPWYARDFLPLLIQNRCIIWTMLYGVQVNIVNNAREVLTRSQYQIDCFINLALNMSTTRFKE